MRKVSRWRVILIFGLLAIVTIVLLLTLAWIEYVPCPSSQDNLEKLGLVFRMYPNEPPYHEYPPLAPYNDLWVPDLRVLYPKFLKDPSILIDPRNRGDLSLLLDALKESPPDWEAAHRIVARSYNYLGFAIRGEEAFAKLLTQPNELVRAAHQRDIAADGMTLHRLHLAVARFFVTDINDPAADAKVSPTIPVAFENVALARQEGRKGCNVLFFDGNVEFVPFGAKFPVVDAVADALPVPPL